MPLHTRAAHTSSASSSSSQPQNQQTAFSFALGFKKRQTCIRKAISPHSAVRKTKPGPHASTYPLQEDTPKTHGEKIPDNVVLHIRAPEIELRCKYSNTQVHLTAEFKPVTSVIKYLEYTLNIHNLKIVFNKWREAKRCKLHVNVSVRLDIKTPRWKIPLKTR